MDNIIMKNKKGIQLNQAFIAVLILISLGVLVIMAIFIFSALGDSSPGIISSSSQTILTSLTTTLSPVVNGITSSSVTANNDTWLEFDGDNDVLVVERFDTISFWYENATTDWTFIVNSSGTLYVNGVLGTPEIYPVHDDGVNMNIGKTDGSTFFNGSIDDFRGYGAEIDSSLVNLTFQDERQ